MKTATINDVAKQAGVSKKTVSRVINNEANVSEEMRAKVQKAIIDTGFKRNPLGMALAKNRSLFIALLTDNPSPGYLMKLQKGILQGCTEEHMGLFLYDCSYYSNSLLKEIEEFIDNTLVDGFVLAPPICDKLELLEMLNRKNIQYIRIGPSYKNQGEFVGLNYHKASYDVASYLIRLNHKRIGYVKGHPDEESSFIKEAGFKQALTDNKIELEDNLMAQGYYTYQSGKDAAALLLNKTPRPTAIFASNDEMAAGVLYEAQSRGIKVPQELSICGIDDISITTKVFPNITTYRHPLVNIGYRAAVLLINRLKNKQNSAPQGDSKNNEIFDGELVIRDSTAQLK
ncbi:LacI family DNA-binding transcriptional regulator [Catenovulum sp. 2E275]|uniref:LacI family DNA-binding transcriptional regulator n=1 Tax=Catenovulum sp. 2E275 TaxID=2980497 RepID=UPI0021D3689A|nr:LacI family DNA-binding transcriptional regulator [Catenovulum sp. 2E275]MCU4675263.1 LacI family DNA-binding transcriptional regulator [Catenovulum sp. 2E275]